MPRELCFTNIGNLSKFSEIDISSELFVLTHSVQAQFFSDIWFVIILLYSVVHYWNWNTVEPGPSSIENHAHGIKKLLLKTQVSWTSSCIVKWIFNTFKYQIPTQWCHRRTKWPNIQTSPHISHLKSNINSPGQVTNKQKMQNLKNQQLQ